MAKKYAIMLGDAERKLVAKAIVEAGDGTFPEVDSLESYWKLRSFVRKPSKAGGVGLFDAPCKKFGVKTWRAWPMPEEATELPVKAGAPLDVNPWPEHEDAGWTAAMAEYEEYVKAKKEEDAAPKPAPVAAPAVVSATKKDSSGVGVVTIAGGWKAKVAAALTAAEKKQMMQDIISFFFA